MNKIVVLGNLGALGNLGDLNVLEKFSNKLFWFLDFIILVSHHLSLFNSSCKPTYL